MIKFNKRAWLFSVRVDRFRGIDPKLLPAALALEAASGGCNNDQGDGAAEAGDPVLRAAARRAARRLRPPPRQCLARARGGYRGHAHGHETSPRPSVAVP